MTSPDESGLEERRSRYLGEVTASLSHEINNVLAIVGELSGLIDDLAHGAAAGRPLDAERVKTIGEKISRHVERGKGFVGTLNRFAHTVDESWSSFDSGASVAAVVGVCERFARLRKVELQLGAAEGWPRLEGSLHDFEQLVFRGIGAALLTVERGGEVHVGLVTDGEAARVEIAASGPAPEREDPGLASRLELIAALAGELGIGIARPEVAERNFTLELSLPEVLRAEAGERSR